ncbi:MAG TPA: hypothetical protein VFM59_07310 [Salinimicrobium sp.]|nr:hypothetical protein [Salinimicrobium sp.]
MKTYNFTKKIFFGIALFGLVTAVSCKDAEQTEAEKNPQTEGTTETSAAAEDSEKGDEIALNPAHGLPNHRCDIPVGAPLNQESSTKITPESTSSNVSPLRVNQTPKINPPHGEPGHSCAIPVGAPLE